MTRYGEERRKGAGLEESIATVIIQSGHVVMVSGLVLTIAYGSMLCLPGANGVSVCFQLGGTQTQSLKSSHGKLTISECLAG